MVKPSDESYKPPRFLFSRHLETIYPALFRKVEHNHCEQLSLPTRDEDFLDMDWYKGVSADVRRVVVLCHGLEGDSQRPYMKGMAKAFNMNKWDAIAWNYRGCGKRMNSLKIFYHSGATYDLDEVVRFAQNHYDQIFLVGFSLGGNLVLKYLGENPHPKIVGAAAFSVPMDLYSCSRELEKMHNFAYSRRFLIRLKRKILAKKKILGDYYPVMQLSKIRSLYEFDELFTAPIHGFRNAMDYYEKCSSLNFVEHIRIPTLIVNAKNDPFLSSKCYPVHRFRRHPFVTLETPEKGGHVGFSAFRQPMYWSEKRAIDFATTLTNLNQHV